MSNHETVNGALVLAVEGVPWKQSDARLEAVRIIGRARVITAGGGQLNGLLVTNGRAEGVVVWERDGSPEGRFVLVGNTPDD